MPKQYYLCTITRRWFNNTQSSNKQKVLQNWFGIHANHSFVAVVDEKGEIAFTVGIGQQDNVSIPSLHNETFNNLNKVTGITWDAVPITLGQAKDIYLDLTWSMKKQNHEVPYRNLKDDKFEKFYEYENRFYDINHKEVSKDFISNYPFRLIFRISKEDNFSEIDIYHANEKIISNSICNYDEIDGIENNEKMYCELFKNGAQGLIISDNLIESHIKLNPQVRDYNNYLIGKNNNQCVDVSENFIEDFPKDIHHFENKEKYRNEYTHLNIINKPVYVNDDTDKNCYALVKSVHRIAFNNTKFYKGGPFNTSSQRVELGMATRKGIIYNNKLHLSNATCEVKIEFNGYEKDKSSYGRNGTIIVKNNGGWYIKIQGEKAFKEVKANEYPDLYQYLHKNGENIGVDLVHQKNIERLLSKRTSRDISDALTQGISTKSKYKKLISEQKYYSKIYQSAMREIFLCSFNQGDKYDEEKVEKLLSIGYELTNSLRSMIMLMDSYYHDLNQNKPNLYGIETDIINSIKNINNLLENRNELLRKKTLVKWLDKNDDNLSDNDVEKWNDKLDEEIAKIDGDLCRLNRKLDASCLLLRESAPEIKSSQKRLLKLVNNVHKSCKLICSYDNHIIISPSLEIDDNQKNILSKTTSCLFTKNEDLYNHAPSSNEMKIVYDVYNMILDAYKQDPQLRAFMGKYNELLGCKISAGSDQVLQSCKKFMSGEGTYGEFLLAVKLGMASEGKNHQLKDKSFHFTRSEKTKKLYDNVVNHVFNDKKISYNQAHLMSTHTLNTIYHNVKNEVENTIDSTKPNI